MKIQFQPVLRQGIWASLTGGWYYDKEQNHFSNAFHLYTWLLLFLFPISIEYLFKNGLSRTTYSYFLWFIYWIVIAIWFTFLKILISYLHGLFENDRNLNFEDSSIFISNYSVEGTSEDSELGIELRETKPKVVNNVNEETIPKSKNLVVTTTKTKADIHNFTENSTPDTNSFYTVSDLDEISKNTNSSIKKKNSSKDDCDLDNNLDSNSECKTLDGMIIHTNDVPKFYRYNSDSFLKNEINSPKNNNFNKQNIDADATSLPSTALIRKNSINDGDGDAIVINDKPGSSLSQRNYKSEELAEESEDSQVSGTISYPITDETIIKILSTRRKKRNQMPLQNSVNKNSIKEIKSTEKSTKTNYIIPQDGQKPTTSRAVSFYDEEKKFQPFSKIHTAEDNEDTSDGATHYYENEFGNLGSYTFGVQNVDDNENKNQSNNLTPDNEFTSLGSGDSSKNKLESNLNKDSSLLTPGKDTLDEQTSLQHVQSLDSNEEVNQDTQETEIKIIGSPINQETEVKEVIHHDNRETEIKKINPQTYNININTRLRGPISHNLPRIRIVRQNDIVHQNLPMNPQSLNESAGNPVKKEFKIKIPFLPGSKSFKVKMDKLALEGFLDKCNSSIEVKFEIVLAVCIAILCSIFVEEKIYTESSFFIYCFVVASCQYSLLKSVQPDAASPIHGFNHTIIYSRPVYFILLSTLVLISKYYRENNLFIDVQFYGVDIFGSHLVLVYENIFTTFILLFPLIFSVGFLPQIDTLCHHILEQIDIHFFGGTGTTSLINALYSTIRNLLLLFFLCIIALFSVEKSSHFKNNQITSVESNIFFSLYCSIMAVAAYIFSRSSNNSYNLLSIINLYRNNGKKKETKIKRLRNQSKDAKNVRNAENENLNANGLENDQESENNDYSPINISDIVLLRIKEELICSILIAIIVFCLHFKGFFKLQDEFKNYFMYFTISLGFFLNYLLPELRTEFPWGKFGCPFLKNYERDLFEVKKKAKLMWFEYLRVYLWLFEKNIVYPFFFLYVVTNDTPIFVNQFGSKFGLILVTICAFKSLRSSLNDCSYNYLIYLMTYLLFNFDIRDYKEPFFLNYFLISILFYKLNELYLKLQFVYVYMAPWQITWGSAFHAFIQPFSFPHSGLLFLQATIASIISAPLQPVLGSTMFFASYVRPIKFWEKNFSTKLIDPSKLKIITQLENQPTDSTNNEFNAIFYEELTNRLQLNLYGDLMLGRWGSVYQGDIFLMESDALNCLVHIIELANGLVTFQVRGLEFKGTFCQDREIAAITDILETYKNSYNESLPSFLNNFLPMKMVFDLIWLAWDIKQVKYVIKGLSISDSEATPWVHSFENRRNLITHFVKSVIYYTIKHKSLKKWITNPGIRRNLNSITNDINYTDMDVAFNFLVDDDYDSKKKGITRSSFLDTYGKWIDYCINELTKVTEDKVKDKEQKIVVLTDDDKKAVGTLCFLMSILARRLFRAASFNKTANTIEFFLGGIHNLFKGEFRLSTYRDEWVFQDLSILEEIIGPSIKLSLKLQQNNFVDQGVNIEYECLYKNIEEDLSNIVITHETDPAWRKAVLTKAKALLSIRHFTEDEANKYRIISLNRRPVSFKIVKVNRECVRGLWAGQQLELIYIRNDDPERGSIQNARQLFRNLINSSCDLPLGYPIYVSSLKTSFGETSKPLKKIYLSPLNFIYSNIFQCLLNPLYSVYEKIRISKNNNPEEAPTNNSRSNDIELNSLPRESQVITDRNISESEEVSRV